MLFKEDAVDPIGIADGYTPATPYDQPEEDAKLVSSIMEMYHVADRAREVYEWRWDAFRLMLKGGSAIYQDPDTQEIVRVVDQDHKRLHSINNQTRIAYRALVGKLTRQQPSFTTIPATNDEVEVHGARVADAFFNYFRRKEKLDIKWIQMQQNVSWCGNAVAQLVWDPLAGRTLGACLECGYTGAEEEIDMDCPQCSLEAQQAMAQAQETNMMAQQLGEPPVEPQVPPVPKLEEVKEGDARVLVCDPRDIYIEPGIVNPMDANWIIKKTPVAVYELRRDYPQLGQHIQPEGGVFTDRTSARTYSVATDTWSTEELSDHVHKYEYYERPTEMYPTGRIVVIANDIILEEKASPYNKFGRLPFFFNFWERNPGEFYAESWLDQAASRQKELNTIESQFREHQELAVRAKMKNPFGSNVSADEITAVSSQIIQYNPATRGPEWMPLPDMPSSAYERKEGIKDDIHQFASITEGERGGAAGDQSGRAAAILEAEADQSIAPIIMVNTDEWGELYRCILILVRDYYSRDRQFTISGDEGQDVFSFEELNLKDGWDLQLEVEDGFSKNKEVRQSQVLNWVNAGIFHDPKTGMLDSSRVVKVAKIKVPGTGVDIASQEVSHAQALINDIEKWVENGMQPEMAPRIYLYDDPEIIGSALQRHLRAKRGRLDPAVEQGITQYYQIFATWALNNLNQQPPPPEVTQGGPGSGLGGPNQSAMGGTPNNTGQEDPSIQSQADQTVQQADQSAEFMSRTAPKHEG